MDFAFFNDKIIRGFTSTVVAICSDTSYPFEFPSRSKLSHLDILKFLVTALRNQVKKVAFIRVYEDGEQSISLEFMKTCHNMNIIVQTTFGYASSLHFKSGNYNKALDNIKRALLFNSIHKKELCYFAYKYYIWLSFQTENRFRGDVPYFL